MYSLAESIFDGQPWYILLSKNVDWNSTTAAYKQNFKTELQTDLILALTANQLSTFIYELEKRGQSFF
tara:strand:+ start:41 stop:244 length:204 start_codon:yes stop_codon:yes gene_type:complete